MHFVLNKSPNSKNPYPFTAAGDPEPGTMTCLFHAGDLTPAALIPVPESSWTLQYVIAFKVRKLKGAGLSDSAINKQVKPWARDYRKHLRGKVYVKTIDAAIRQCIERERTGDNTRPDEAVYVGEGKYFKLTFPRGRRD